MSETVLVVHGVNNHDAERFAAEVDALQDWLGGHLALKNVFWGDLGGIGHGLEDTLPPRSGPTRGAGEVAWDAYFAQQREVLAAVAEATRAAGGPAPDALAEALYRGATGQPPAPAQAQDLATRAGDDLLDVLRQALPETRYLRTLQDPALQQAVGDLLADYLGDRRADDAFGGGGLVTRGWGGDLRESVRRFIGKVDGLIGQAVSAAAGGANQWLRAALAQPISRTFGDIVAYHQRRGEIHQRLFETLDAEAPGMGTPQRPITVVAHSLGGLACLDAALGSDVLQQGQRRQLHIRRLVTMGSQPAFFHVLAPREGLPRYEPGQPVTLPKTIGRWVNLWHPMDPLAFVVAPVFRLADTSEPLDRRIDTPLSEIAENKGWMHSAYWRSAALMEALEPLPAPD